MSTERFDIRHAPAPRESFRLLYINDTPINKTGINLTRSPSWNDLLFRRDPMNYLIIRD